MVFCKHCHNLLPKTAGEAKFCPFCGNKVPQKDSVSALAFADIIVFVVAGGLYALFFGIFIASPIYSSGILGNFLQYSNIYYNVTIDYPINWQYKEDFDSNTVVAFRPPASDTSKADHVGLGIYVDKLLFYVPLNQLAENNTYDNSLRDIMLSQCPENNSFDGSSNIPLAAWLTENNTQTSLGIPLADRLAENDMKPTDLENPLTQCEEHLVLKVPWNLSLEEYTRYKIDAIKIRYPDIKYTRTSLNGNDAFNATYSFSSNNTDTREKEDLKVTQIWTIKNDRAYIITYVVKEDQYADYLHILRKMINSFNIT